MMPPGENSGQSKTLDPQMMEELEPRQSRDIEFNEQIEPIIRSTELSVRKKVLALNELREQLDKEAGTFFRIDLLLWNIEVGTRKIFNKKLRTLFEMRLTAYDDISKQSEVFIKLLAACEEAFPWNLAERTNLRNVIKDEYKRALLKDHFITYISKKRSDKEWEQLE